MFPPVEYGIAYGFEEETLEAKVAWHLTMTPNERLREAFLWLPFVDALSNAKGPNKVKLSDDRSSFTTVQVLERPRG